MAAREGSRSRRCPRSGSAACARAVASGGEWADHAVVPVTTLDALIDRYGLPAFCKIDVEGFEEAVVRGLSRPIPSVSFEFTPETSTRPSGR